VAEMHQITVMVFPFSALVSTPIERFPLAASILRGAWQIVNPVSSQLKMLSGGIFRNPSALNNVSFKTA